MYSQIVIYKKPNGQILYRATTSIERREIGQKNNYGWEIVGIQKIKNGKCYSLNEYNTLLQQKQKWSRATRRITRTIEKLDPAEIMKWGFIAFLFLKLCQ